jgi:glucose/arabinose dehydrogenase/PKD repeat protein
MQPTGRALVLLICLLLAALAGPARAHALMVPPADFEDQFVLKLLSGTALAFTPDGRLLVTNRDGAVKVYENGAPLAGFAVNIRPKTCFNLERGLLGIAVDPAFATNHRVYLYYTWNKHGTCDTSGPNTPVNRVSSFVLDDNDVIDPATETVLLDNIPSPSGLHNGGDIQFGKDGFLYVAVGDGNCDFRGYSGCGPGNDASRDLSSLMGKILRITADGQIPVANPYQGSGTARCNTTGSVNPPDKCREVFAFGLRNPWRLAFNPNSPDTAFHINDVGLGHWEEVDVGAAAADYGWNLREGPCATASYADCGPPPFGSTNPTYAYDHATGCEAITGGAFVPNGAWPAAYDNTYLYGDLDCGRMFRLTATGNGGWTASEFASPVGTNWIISMTFGPSAQGQALYYITYGDGNADQHEVRRIVHTGTAANRAPIAKASATPTSGPAPLAVNFDGSASSDPNNDALSFEWDFGDGTPPQTGAKVSHTYGSGVRTAVLRVTDGRGGEDTDSVTIYPGDRPPVPRIDAPIATKRFAVGEQITLTGSATDPDETGPLPDSALTFEVRKHHNTHFHPFLPPTAGNNVPIVAPQPEDIDSTENSYLEIILTATDRQGLTASISQELRPSLVNLTFDTIPSGLRLRIAGTTVTAPRTFASWKSWGFGIDAPDQSRTTGAPFAFTSWSDGGARSHSLTTPNSSATYRASFAPAGYARPTAATPNAIRLVPAFRQCSAQAAGGSHGAPLNRPSCGHPSQESGTLTIGTPDANGHTAESTAVATLKVFCTDGAAVPCPAAGDTEDVEIHALVSDVRCRTNNAACPAGSGSAYPGRLLLLLPLQLTDRLSGVLGTAAATTSGASLQIPFSCTPAMEDLGSTCAVTTTADAFYPGVAEEGSRSVWELGPLAILDAGSNGTGYGSGCPRSCGDGDEEVFMRQGLFAP